MCVRCCCFVQADAWYYVLGGDFHPDNVLIDECDSNTPGSINYWLLPDATANIGFIVDRGCEEPFNLVHLKNTHNANAMDRLDCT